MRCAAIGAGSVSCFERQPRSRVRALGGGLGDVLRIRWVRWVLWGSKQGGIGLQARIGASSRRVGGAAIAPLHRCNRAVLPQKNQHNAPNTSSHQTHRAPRARGRVGGARALLHLSDEHRGVPGAPRLRQGAVRPQGGAEKGGAGPLKRRERPEQGQRRGDSPAGTYHPTIPSPKER